MLCSSDYNEGLRIAPNPQKNGYSLIALGTENNNNISRN